MARRAQRQRLGADSAAQRQRLRQLGPRRERRRGALGARLRERDLSAAPAALNLLESATPADREQAAALLREVSPAGARRRGAGARDRDHRTAGRGQVDAALGAASRLAAQPSGTGRRSRCSPSTRARAAPAARCWATARGSSSTPADRGVLIRSTAAGERLGGLAWPTRAAAHALAAAFDVVVIETVGVGQAETEIVDVADTVAVVVQPGSGDALQFLKSGIMEIPDVLVVTKADLGQLAVRTRRDLSAALRSLGSRSTPVLAVSSLPPPQGIEELARGARGAPRRPRPRRAATARPARRARWPNSRTSTASAGCARSAAVTPRRRCWPSRSRAWTCPRSWRRAGAESIGADDGA